MSRNFSQIKAMRGFTLVEVLVVVGVVGLLIALLAPALRAVKASGRQTLELSAARQLMAAYAAYAAANRDAVLPGYLDSPRAYDAGGTLIAGGQLDVAKRRYVWRLAPYLKHNLRGLYVGDHAELLERLEQQDYAAYLYAASVSPSLGLNTEWIGGDSTAYGFLPATHPLRNALDLNRFYLTSMSQAQNSEMLMVFASARGIDPENNSADTVEGYFKVRSPYFTQFEGIRWSADFDPDDAPVNYGYISPRYDGKAVTALIDGHTEMKSAEQLRDMRHWANWATNADWRLPQIQP